MGGGWGRGLLLLLPVTLVVFIVSIAAAPTTASATLLSFSGAHQRLRAVHASTGPAPCPSGSSPCFCLQHAIRSEAEPTPCATLPLSAL